MSRRARVVRKGVWGLIIMLIVIGIVCGVLDFGVIDVDVKRWEGGEEVGGVVCGGGGEDVGGGDEGARDAVDVVGDEEIVCVGLDFVEGFVEGGVGVGVFGVEEMCGGVGVDDEGGVGGGAGFVYEEWGFGE